MEKKVILENPNNEDMDYLRRLLKAFKIYIDDLEEAVKKNPSENDDVNDFFKEKVGSFIREFNQLFSSAMSMNVNEGFDFPGSNLLSRWHRGHKSAVNDIERTWNRLRYGNPWGKRYNKGRGNGGGWFGSSNSGGSSNGGTYNSSNGYDQDVSLDELWERYIDIVGTYNEKFASDDQILVHPATQL